jgi:hypothetical protein
LIGALKTAAGELESACVAAQASGSERMFCRGSMQHSLLRYLGTSSALTLPFGYRRQPRGEVFERRYRHFTSHLLAVGKNLGCNLNNSKKSE